MGIKIYLIIFAFINPSEKEAFDHYVSGIRQQYEQVGASPVRYPISHMVMGEEKPDFIMVVEFPDQQSLQKLFSSDEYAKLVPYREKAFKKLNVFISPKE